MKKDGRSISRETLENYRFQALKLRKNGWKVNKIAEAFGINRGSVSSWFTKVKRYGENSLKSTKAKGKKPKLNLENRKTILGWLKESAVEFGFENPLWTCKMIQQMIKKELKISLSISKIWEWLQKWNITNQKPERQAKQRDEKLVKKWIKEEWPKIDKHRRRWQAMIYFVDEAGVSLIPVLGKTWALKGKTPKVKVTGNRGGFCVSSAISPGGKMIFRIEKGKVNSDSYLDFLQKIIKQHPRRKIIVIADNAPAHKSAILKGFEESNKTRFAMYNIPPYSPDLNPDEHVWAYLKAKSLLTHQANSVSELKEVANRKMKAIQKNKGLINSFFMHSYVI